MNQVRIWDENNARVSYDSVKLETEYTGNPACTPPLHRFQIGSKRCTCGKYDGTPKPEEEKEAIKKRGKK